MSTLPGFISVTVNWYYEHSHFTGEEMEAQRSWDTCPQSQSITAQVIGPPSLLSLLRGLVTGYHWSFWSSRSALWMLCSRNMSLVRVCRMDWRGQRLGRWRWAGRLLEEAGAVIKLHLEPQPCAQTGEPSLCQLAVTWRPVGFEGQQKEGYS